MSQDDQKLLVETARLCLLNKQEIDNLQNKFIELFSLLVEVAQIQERRNKLVLNALKLCEEITTATANSTIDLYEAVEALQKTINE